MTIDFYYLPGSAPCRAVQMTAKAVGVELNLKLTDLMAGQHMTPEFLKLNPQHTIPTIVDNGFSLAESRAIMIYLQEKYGKTDDLYPNNPQKRAIINQRLMFDQGTLYQPIFKHLMLVFKRKPADPEYLANIKKALDILNSILEKSLYVAGDQLTLADISIYSSVSTIKVCNYDFNEFTNVTKWFDLVNEIIPGHELNDFGLKVIKERIDSGAEFKRKRNE